MHKILNTGQIRALDATTIGKEGILSVELMERAATACFRRLLDDFPHCGTVVVWAGPGNNGGDGLALARMLNQVGKRCMVILCGTDSERSHDCTINLNRLLNTDVPVTPFGQLGALPPLALHIDCLFGTGLSRPLSDTFALCVDLLNRQKEIVSIDLPSGLPAEPNIFTPSPENAVVRASKTYTFDAYKLSLLLDDFSKYYGDVVVLDIGLDQSFKDHVQTDKGYWMQAQIQELLRDRDPYGHKGSNGKALIAAGSEGMIGSAVLCGRAALRSGLGLLTMHVPAFASTVIHCQLPEALVLAAESNAPDFRRVQPEHFNAIGIGCGIGTGPDTADRLEHFLRIVYHGNRPLVLDADALNIISRRVALLDILADKPVILTPHPLEFDRLFGVHGTHYDRLLDMQKVCSEKGIHILLKGANTWIGLPDGTLHAFPFPNSGLSKGGSGDVLCGLVTSFLAQGYGIPASAFLSVGLQAMSAENCARKWSAQAMLPSDLFQFFPNFFSTGQRGLKP